MAETATCTASSPGAPSLRIKAQLFCGNEIAMGPGKADVLEAIRQHGSISAAGRVLGISYRRVWLLVDTMNRCWQEPLVVTGAGARGATVTALGEQVLADYRALQARIDAAAGQDAHSALFTRILPEPRNSRRA